MGSLNQWMLWTTACVVLDVSLRHNSLRIMQDVLWVTLSVLIADLLWAAWLSLSKGQEQLDA
jgi:hypothetical protein